MNTEETTKKTIFWRDAGREANLGIVLKLEKEIN